MMTGRYSIRRNLKTRFEAAFIPEPNSGCWIWLGATTTHRNFIRGTISSGGKNCVASRVSFNLYKGSIPTGKIVCHRCNNSLCVNPEHLYAGTYKENTADMWRAGRGRTPFRDHKAAFHKSRIFIPVPASYSKSSCDNGHLLSVEGVYVRPNGRMECRKCKRDSNISYKNRSRANMAQ